MNVSFYFHLSLSLSPSLSLHIYILLKYIYMYIYIYKYICIYIYMHLYVTHIIIYLQHTRSSVTRRGSLLRTIAALFACIVRGLQPWLWDRLTHAVLASYFDCTYGTMTEFGENVQKIIQKRTIDGAF